MFAAAQLCGYYVSAANIPLAGDFLGFGGLENVRFRHAVHPGDRLVLVGKGSRLKPRQMLFIVQGFGLGGVISSFGLVVDLIGFLLLVIFVLASSLIFVRRDPPTLGENELVSH